MSYKLKTTLMYNKFKVLFQKQFVDNEKVHSYAKSLTEKVFKKGWNTSNVYKNIENIIKARSEGLEGLRVAQDEYISNILNEGANVVYTEVYRESYDYILGSDLTKSGKVFYGGVAGINNAERDKKVAGTIKTALSALQQKHKLNLFDLDKSYIYFIARAIERLSAEKGVITDPSSVDSEIFDIQRSTNVKSTKLYRDCKDYLSTRVSDEDVKKQLDDVIAVTLTKLHNNGKVDFKKDDTSNSYFVTRSVEELIAKKGAVTNPAAVDLKFFDLLFPDNIQRTKVYQQSYDYLLGSKLTKKGGVFYGGVFGMHNKERDQKVQNVVVEVLSNLHKSGKIDLTKDNNSLMYFISRSIEKFVVNKCPVTGEKKDCNLDFGSQDLTLFNPSSIDSIQRTKMFDDIVGIITNKFPLLMGVFEQKGLSGFASKIANGVLLKDTGLVRGDQNTAYIVQTCTKIVFDSVKTKLEVMIEEKDVIKDRIYNCIQDKQTNDLKAIIPETEVSVVGDDAMLLPDL